MEKDMDKDTLRKIAIVFLCLGEFERTWKDLHLGGGFSFDAFTSLDLSTFTHKARMAVPLAVAGAFHTDFMVRGGGWLGYQESDSLLLGGDFQLFEISRIFSFSDRLFTGWVPMTEYF